MRKAKQSVADEVRGWGRVLGYWHVCDNAACHAAQACRGDIARCAPGNFARLPQGVQAWFVHVLDAREEGLTVDAAMEALDGEAAGAAFAQWRAVLRAATRPSRASRLVNPRTPSG